MNKKFVNKIAIILGLVVALMIPLSMIEGVVSDRSYYRDSAKASIAQSWTGAQKFLGPILVVPYVERYKQKSWDKNLEKYIENTYRRDEMIYILPETLQVNGDILTEERKRGIYSIPVYSSKLKVSGAYDNSALRELHKNNGSNITWKKPYLSMMVSDIRGITEQPKINWNNNEYDFASGSSIEGWANGMNAMLPTLATNKTQDYTFSFEVNLNGMESVQFSPVGETTEINIKANWPHPSFVGRYLPKQRNITETDFDASWELSSFSSDMPRLIKTCQQGNCKDFINNTFGVSLINPVDIYQKTERSVKYAILFISLTFIVFFLFEIMKNLRLHPMQYLLVGMALTFFYLLLISLSEHMKFLSAYTISTLASIVVITIYLSAVLKSRLRALAFSSSLLLLYAMLYGILVSEDNSMLMGSLLFFGILSLVMIVTRKLDWYKVTEELADRVVLKGEGEVTD